MDTESVNYLLTELKGYINEKIGTLDGKFGTLDDKIGTLDGKIETLKDYIDKKTEALDRKMGVLAEAAQKERALLAEGISTVNDKLDRHIEEQSILYITDKHLENRFQHIEQRLTAVEEKQRA